MSRRMHLQGEWCAGTTGTGGTTDGGDRSSTRTVTFGCVNTWTGGPAAGEELAERPPTAPTAVRSTRNATVVIGGLPARTASILE